MCIAAPGRVIRVNDRQVEVKYPGIEEVRRAMLSGDEVKAGDYVMVQMGIVVRVLEEEDAKGLEERWEEVS